jgi:hypothetical protein
MAASSTGGVDWPHTSHMILCGRERGNEDEKRDSLLHRELLGESIDVPQAEQWGGKRLAVAAELR